MNTNNLTKQCKPVSDSSFFMTCDEKAKCQSEWSNDEEFYMPKEKEDSTEKEQEPKQDSKNQPDNVLKSNENRSRKLSDSHFDVTAQTPRKSKQQYIHLDKDFENPQTIKEPKQPTIRKAQFFCSPIESDAFQTCQSVAQSINQSYESIPNNKSPAPPMYSKVQQKENIPHNIIEELDEEMEGSNEHFLNKDKRPHHSTSQTYQINQNYTSTSPKKTAVKLTSIKIDMSCKEKKGTFKTPVKPKMQILNTSPITEFSHQNPDSIAQIQQIQQMESSSINVQQFNQVYFDEAQQQRAAFRQQLYPYDQNQNIVYNVAKRLFTVRRSYRNDFINDMEILANDCDKLKNMNQDDTKIIELIDNVNHQVNSIIEDEKVEKWYPAYYVSIYIAFMCLLLIISIFTQSFGCILLFTFNFFVACGIIQKDFVFEKGEVCQNNIVILSHTYQKHLYTKNRQNIHKSIDDWNDKNSEQLNIRIKFKGKYFEILEFNFLDED